MKEDARIAALEMQVNTLIGKETATRAVIVSLIASHPEKPLLLQHLQHASEMTLAKSLPTAASDELISAAETSLSAYVLLLQKAVFSGQ